MRQLLRALAIAAAIVAGVLLLAAGYLYAASERRLTRRYTVAPVAFAILRDSASVAHGKHLFEAVTPCALCHGADAGGNVYMHSPAMGTMAGPNLTRGHGSAVAGFTPADWDRAVRHGVRQNGTSLIVMPSEVFTFMNNADLGAIVGYLESAPPVDRQVPRSDFGPVGRALSGAGEACGVSRRAKGAARRGAGDRSGGADRCVWSLYAASRAASVATASDCLAAESRVRQAFHQPRTSRPLASARGPRLISVAQCAKV